MTLATDTADETLVPDPERKNGASVVELADTKKKAPKSAKPAKSKPVSEAPKKAGATNAVADEPATVSHKTKRRGGIAIGALGALATAAYVVTRRRKSKKRLTVPAQPKDHSPRAEHRD